MSSTSIDALLKISAQPAKRAAPTPPRDASADFDNYLRKAASAPTASEKPSTTEELSISEQPADKQVAASGQEQGATASPDDDSLEAKDVEQTDENTTEPVEESPVDELALSVAASVVTVTATSEMTVTVGVVVEETTVEPAMITGQAEPGPNEIELPGNSLFPETEVPTVEGLAVEKAATTSSDVERQSVMQVAEEATEKILVATEVAVAEPQAAMEYAPVVREVVAVKKPDTSVKEKSVRSAASAEDAAKSSVLDKALDIPLPVMAEATVTTQIKEQTCESQSKLTVDAPTPTYSVNSQATNPGMFQPTNNLPVNNEAVVTRGELDAPTPTLDRTRFVQRVANAFRLAQQNDGQIQMRLSPPELGSLRIEIAVRNGVLSANVEAETVDARKVLLDNLPALRQRLAEQDIRIDKFEVDIRQDGGQQDGQASAREQQSEQQANRAAEQNRIRTPKTPEVLATRVSRAPLSDTDAGLDVRI